MWYYNYRDHQYLRYQYLVPYKKISIIHT